AGQHLAWGYVDMPPLTALTAQVARTLFNDSIVGIHLIPALAGAGLVLLTGAIVRELGGKWFAQALAGLSVVVAGSYLMSDSYLSMNAMEPLIWMGCVLILIRMVKTGNTRLWLAFGVLAGVGLLNKHTMLVFGAAVTAGILLTSTRKLMGNRWFFLGGTLALLIFLPNLIWMIQHNFPHLEQLANIRRNQRNIQLDPLGYMVQQIIYQNPQTLPLWAGGLVYFLIHSQGKAFRFVTWTYILALGLLLVTDGRPYYLSPIYPVLLAGGAVGFEGWLMQRRWWGWLKPAVFVLLSFSGVVSALNVLPLLTPEQYIQYTKTIGFSQPQIENAHLNALPQLFALRFGWPEMVAATAKVYDSLTPEEQAKTIIFTGNYGEAGAIDFFGPPYGLPKAMSGHLNYFYWGQELAPMVQPGTIVIALGRNPDQLKPYFESVRVAGLVHHPYAIPYENFPIYLCRGLKVPLEQLWPEVKDFS
ncbi:MAG TPA: glycosyltransferase family 39 protein, partial [Phototrophicaceae bacterium]|nr:glycosyltransferase family 39 protein [Phototrophicaceae bacterium]